MPHTTNAKIDKEYKPLKGCPYKPTKVCEKLKEYFYENTYYFDYYGWFWL